MKKITALIAALLLMLCTISAVSADEMSGVWYLNMLVIDGNVMNAADIGMEMELRLNEDGTAASASGEDGAEGTWEPVDNGVTVTIEGEPLTLEFTEGYLVADSDGVTMAFGREKPAPAFVPAEEIAAESIEAFNGTYTAAYIDVGGSIYPYEAVADQLVPMLGATSTDIVIDSGSVSALGSENVPYAFEDGMLILADEGEMAEYTTQTVKMLADGSISYGVMGITFYCTASGSDAVLMPDEPDVPDEPVEPDEAAFKGSWTLVSISSGDVTMDAAESGMSMDLTVTDTEMIRTSFGDAVTEVYTVNGNELTTESGVVYTFEGGVLSADDEGVTMIFEKNAEAEPDITEEVEYAYRVDSVYYTEVNGLLNRAADLMETGEMQTAYGEQPVIEAPESELEGYELDESLSQLTVPAGSEGEEQIYIAVFVKHVTEYAYRVDSVYYTEVNGLMRNEIDLQVTGEEERTYEKSLTVAAPESELEGYAFSEELSELEFTFDDTDNVYVFTAVYVRSLTEYAYRVDSVYYTEVNGLMRNETDLQVTGEEQRTYEAGLTVAASESELEGYALSEGLSELEFTFDDTDNVYVFTAVYVRSLTEYTYRVDSVYYTEVNGLMRNETDLQVTGEEQRTYAVSLTVAAPESELEGYALSEGLSDLELTFDDTENVYVFTAVYIRSLSEYGYRVDCLYRVMVDGVIDETRDVTKTAYEAKTTENSLRIAAPESALEGYAFADGAPENMLSITFGDTDETYVFTAVYIREESLFIGRSFTAYGVVMGGYVLENEDVGEIKISFSEDGKCLLALMGREVELEWTYSDGAISVDYFGEELYMCVNEVYLEEEDGRTAIQIEADMAGYMTVLFEEDK